MSRKGGRKAPRPGYGAALEARATLCTGDVAPDFTLPDTDGGSWRLRDQRDRTTLLVFLRYTG